MENRRSNLTNLKLGEKFRGMHMNDETKMIMESIQGMESRIMKHLDGMQASMDKIKDQTSVNENVLTDHKARLATTERDIAELKNSNEKQHGEFYSAFRVVDGKLSVQEGKSSTIPIIISVISVITAAGAVLLGFLK